MTTLNIISQKMYFKALLAAKTIIKASSQLLKV